MLNEVRKYRAQFFQIAGISCMSPLGKCFLDIKEIHRQDLNLAFLVHILVSLLLFFTGIMFIKTGLKIIKGEK